MLRSTSFNYHRLAAGLVVCKGRVAVSFLSVGKYDAPVASYIGDFNFLEGCDQFGGRYKSSKLVVPSDIPASLSKGHRLMTLFDQLPELSETRLLAINSEYFSGQMSFEFFLRRKGIETEDVTSLLSNIPKFYISDEHLIDMAREATKTLDRAEEVDKWLSSRGFK